MPSTDLVGQRRTSVSTRARCTAVAFGDGGAGRPGELLAGRAEVEVQPLERVGLERENHAVDGPAGRAVGAQSGSSGRRP
jgi:hypothetical protein